MSQCSTVEPLERLCSFPYKLTSMNALYGEVGNGAKTLRNNFTHTKYSGVLSIFPPKMYNFADICVIT